MHFGVPTCRHVQDAPGLTKEYDASGNRDTGASTGASHFPPTAQETNQARPSLASCGTTQSAAHGRWAGGTSLALPEPQCPTGNLAPRCGLCRGAGGGPFTRQRPVTCLVMCGPVTTLSWRPHRQCPDKSAPTQRLWSVSVVVRRLCLCLWHAPLQPVQLNVLPIFTIMRRRRAGRKARSSQAVLHGNTLTKPRSTETSTDSRLDRPEIA